MELSKEEIKDLYDRMSKQITSDEAQFMWQFAGFLILALVLAYCLNRKE